MYLATCVASDGLTTGALDGSPVRTKDRPISNQCPIRGILDVDVWKLCSVCVCLYMIPSFCGHQRSDGRRNAWSDVDIEHVCMDRWTRTQYINVDCF